MSNVRHASIPVLRVTAFGASAFARFYNRRLPTIAEWLHASGNGSELQPAKPAAKIVEGISENQEVEGMHEQMHDRLQTGTPDTKTPLGALSSVVDYGPNRYGIRGLGNVVKEWGLWPVQTNSKDNSADAEYVVLPTTIRRQPWEAFDSVGFRCVREIRTEEIAIRGNDLSEVAE